MEASSQALGSSNMTGTLGSASNTLSYQKLQPKFKDCTLDSDKKPEYLRTWIRLLTGIVRNIAGGKPLENFIDNVLGRREHEASTRPAFLNDPVFQLHSPYGAQEGDSPDPALDGE